MTLSVGIVCSDGVIEVADRKLSFPDKPPSILYQILVKFTQLMLI